MGNNCKFILEYNEYLKTLEESMDLYIYSEIKKRTKFNRLAIVEGLIFTHPTSKSVNIIEKRFPELIVRIEEDGEIYIEGKFDKLVKYLPIFTNLGYFISMHTIDGENWLKEYDETVKPIALYLEAKYDLCVITPHTLYHASTIVHKDKISKIGFIPKSGDKKSAHPERIYLTDKLDVAVSFGENIKSESGSGYCIYEIDGKCVEKLYSDVNLRENGYYTLQNIPPKCFSMIKEIVN